MKKRSFARAFAVAAAMAVGASAFAQVTINGYYRVGARDNIDAAGNQSVNFDDRIRLNLSYAAPDDMFGFKARLQADAKTVTSTAIGAAAATTTVYSGWQNLFLNTLALDSKSNGTDLAPASLSYAQAYAKFFDGVIKATAGLLSVSDYQVYENTGNLYLGKVATDAPALGSYSYLNSKTAALLQAWPVEGLSVAAVSVLDGSAIDLSHLGLDAYYLVPGLGKVIIASQLGSYNIDGTKASNDIAKSFASAAFQYLGFPGLSATAALRFNGAAKNAISAIAIVEYSAGPLFANVSADADFSNSIYYAEGELSYAVLPQLKVRGYGAYDYNAAGKALTLDKAKYDTVAGGADLVFPVGKGEVSAGVRVGDKSVVQVPVLVKVNF